MPWLRHRCRLRPLREATSPPARRLLSMLPSPPVYRCATDRHTCRRAGDEITGIRAEKQAVGTSILAQTSCTQIVRRHPHHLTIPWYAVGLLSEGTVNHLLGIGSPSLAQRRRG